MYFQTYHSNFLTSLKVQFFKREIQRMEVLWITLLCILGGTLVQTATYTANPSNYVSVISSLRAGDTLNLEAGRLYER
jgi:hypothetical protein